MAARNRRREHDVIKFTIKLTGGDVARWHALAQKQGISFEELVKESVEMAIARGSSR